jgi:hypothetical protein
MTILQAIAAISTALTVAVAAMFIWIMCVDVGVQPELVPLDELLEEEE